MFLGRMETKKREEWNGLQSRAFSMFDATKAERLELKNGAVACVYPTCKRLPRLHAFTPLAGCLPAG